MYVGCLANQDLRQKNQISFQWKVDFVFAGRHRQFGRNTETKCHRTESSSFWSEIIADENPPLEIVRWLRKNRPHLKVVQINLLATFHFSSSKNWIRRHNTSLPDNKRIIRLFWLLVQLHFSCNNLRPHQMRRSDTRQGPASPQKSSESKWGGEPD